MDNHILSELTQAAEKRARQKQQQKVWYENNKEKMLIYHRKRNDALALKTKELKCIELVKNLPHLHAAILDIINQSKSTQNAQDV